MKHLAVACLFVFPLLAGKTAANQSDQVIASIQAKSADDLIGDWKLSLETYDDNHNKKLDEDERKKGFSNHYFYRFSGDGSCIISPFVTNQLKNGFKGHYVVNEKNGKKILTTYWDETEQKGHREAQYTVVSVNKEELVLLETTGDYTFWIFKRVG
jgi:hypothetical protein